MVEVAFILPLLLFLIAGMLIFGLATVELIRLERAVTDAAMVKENEARKLVANVGGEMTCWWRGTGPGECFHDRLTMHRTQVVATGRTWTYPTGEVTPTARSTRPTETTTTTEGTIP